MHADVVIVGGRVAGPSGRAAPDQGGGPGPGPGGRRRHRRHMSTEKVDGFRLDRIGQLLSTSYPRTAPHPGPRHGLVLRPFLPGVLVTRAGHPPGPGSRPGPGAQGAHSVPHAPLRALPGRRARPPPARRPARPRPARRGAGPARGDPARPAARPARTARRPRPGRPRPAAEGAARVRPPAALGAALRSGPDHVQPVRRPRCTRSATGRLACPRARRAARAAGEHPAARHRTDRRPSPPSPRTPSPPPSTAGPPAAPCCWRPTRSPRSRAAARSARARLPRGHGGAPRRARAAARRARAAARRGPAGSRRAHSVISQVDPTRAPAGRALVSSTVLGRRRRARAALPAQPRPYGTSTSGWEALAVHHDPRAVPRCPRRTTRAGPSGCSTGWLRVRGPPGHQHRAGRPALGAARGACGPHRPRPAGGRAAAGLAGHAGGRGGLIAPLHPRGLHRIYHPQTRLVPVEPIRGGRPHAATLVTPATRLYGHLSQPSGGHRRAKTSP